MNTFSHLHVHTEYSILDGLAKIPKLIKKAYDDGQRAIAITDHGNMYGAFEFLNIIEGFNQKLENPEDKLKGILGCEVYVAKNDRSSKTLKEDRGGRHLILLAKNMEGYKNLSKLVSYSFLDGFYYVPRIDKTLLRQYSKGLIACSACLGGELAKSITNYNQLLPNGDIPKNLDLTEAHKVVAEFKEIFGEDYYLEMQMNNHGEQKLVNHAITILSEAHQVKYIASNDVHYVDKEDFDAHRVLICINTRRELTDASSAMQDSDTDTGMAYSGMEYLCTAAEMRERFAQYPDAIDNTIALTDKIESFSLYTDPLLPVFPVPEEFDSEFAYLEHLVYEGAQKRWPEITPEIEERIQFELATIKNMGFPGYFLIVWDFMIAGKKLGVRFGPGRGSAAGSVIAYCMNITNVDPIEYHLLFERFLNPDRISLPDMDIDMDDKGREKVMMYVREKYGEDKVAQIITFNTMAAKSAIKDCARVLKLPLEKSNYLSKLVPEKPGTKLEGAYKEVPALQTERTSGEDLVQRTLSFAEQLENTVRANGVHACGMIIGKEPLIEQVPLSSSKNSEIPVTQYEGKYIEQAGLLKMDFLGLKTLNIINSAVELIKLGHNLDLNIDALPLDDEATYNLLGRGDTTSVFQLESAGMRKYLAELKPTRFDDIIAMVSLYRPGPMDKIPSFINRKFGKEAITYDIGVMEKYLSDTYGITIYQEQVMLLSRLLANFTPGQADSLRKAMGKKNLSLMASLYKNYLEGGKANGHNEKTLEKIWKEWEKFAAYAFNKSHATCYALIAYQTAYLKAHYLPEFMASNLTNNLDKMDTIKKVIDDALKSGIKVLGPTVNESYADFSVNKEGNILFGLAALKGVGLSAVEAIVQEREANGKFTSVFDFVKRVDLRQCTKKSIESLVYAGAFDVFENVHRAQFFNMVDEKAIFLEKLVAWGAREQNAAAQQQFSLFGESPEAMEELLPVIPKCEPWPEMVKLTNEFQVAGFYISGHPLERFEAVIKDYCNVKLSDIKEEEDRRKYVGKTIRFAAMVTAASHYSAAESKNNKDSCRITLKDFSDTLEQSFFSNDYLKIKNLLSVNAVLFFKCKVTESKPYNEKIPTRVFINPVEVMPMYETFNKLIKRIQLSIVVNLASKYLAYKLLEVIEQCKGDTPLAIQIKTSDDRVNCDFFGHQTKVDPEKFLQEIATVTIPYDIKLL